MQPVLATLLETIDVPEHTTSTDPQFFVKTIPNFESHYFGRTYLNTPCLLICARDCSLRAPIRLAAIEVSFAIPCNISLADGEEKTQTLTAITCTSSDQVVQSYFVHICETLLHIIGNSPSLQEVVEVVRRLVNLFQKLSNPARRSVIGLFGELYVIYSANSPTATVEAWRGATDDRFDFSVNDVRLEVKASSTRRRVHEFSLEQCTPPLNTDGILISLFVEASGGGISLLDLIERIKVQLGSNLDLLLKLQGVVAEALGDNISSALLMRFDENLAKNSLQVYDLQSIPAIRTKIPTEVSQIRFRSDLSRSPVSDIKVLASRSKTLKNLLPK